MSSEGTLAKDEYTTATVNQAYLHTDFVIGFISRHRLTEDPQFIHMTPGVNRFQAKDKLGQQYLTPHKVIVELGNDIIIVGRGIYEAADPQAEAAQYRKEGWAAYLETIANP
jgi:uridine monophosphate synthetase